MHSIHSLDLPDLAQLEIWKKMSFEKKYEVFCGLQHQAREMKRAMFKHQFPELSDEEIHQKVVKFFLHATT
jgi:hypothetical protein